MAELAQAARAGDLLTLERLLAHRTGADYSDGAVATALFVAACNNHIPIVERLLTVHGVDVNCLGPNNIGRAPLCAAASNGQLPAVECLVAHGANINRTDNNGATVLHVAASSGRLPIVEYLLVHGADVNRATTSHGETALYLAVHGKHLPVAECLLAHGADPNHVTNDGGTALYTAVYDGSLPMVECLLKHKVDVDYVNDYDETALWWATCHGHLPIVNRLLEYQFGSGRWICDVEVFETFLQQFQQQGCALARCWSANLGDSYNLLNVLPVELLHLLLISMWEEYQPSVQSE